MVLRQKFNTENSRNIQIKKCNFHNNNIAVCKTTLKKNKSMFTCACNVFVAFALATKDLLPHNATRQQFCCNTLIETKQ